MQRALKAYNVGARQPDSKFRENCNTSVHQKTRRRNAGSFNNLYITIKNVKEVKYLEQPLDAKLTLITRITNTVNKANYEMHKFISDNWEV